MSRTNILYCTTMKLEWKVRNNININLKQFTANKQCKGNQGQKQIIPYLGHLIC